MSNTLQNPLNIANQFILIIGSASFAVGAVVMVLSTYLKKNKKKEYERVGNWIWVGGSILFLIVGIIALLLIFEVTSSSSSQ